MKYLSPLLLAYDDRMKEKDALMKTTEVKYVVSGGCQLHSFYKSCFGNSVWFLVVTMF